MSEIRRLLERSQPGSSGGVRQHIQRGEHIAELITKRFSLPPRKWQAKHLRWVLQRGLADLSPATRYHYYRTARVIASALSRWSDWEPYLRGPWTTPADIARKQRLGTGRPPKLALASHGRRATVTTSTGSMS